MPREEWRKRGGWEGGRETGGGDTSYNGSQLTPSKSQSPDNGKQSSTETAPLHHSEIPATLHLAHCSAATCLLSDP